MVRNYWVMCFSTCHCIALKQIRKLVKSFPIRPTQSSGKTSIAKQLFNDVYIRGFEYSHKCVLDDFPEALETGEITKTLCSVGFASPPDWLKNYDCLSQGEKMRVDIARALCLDKQVIVFDEFSSVVDREIAKISAFAIGKAVRRSQKKFIAVTCHYDVVDWLDPDWVFCTDTKRV